MKKRRLYLTSKETKQLSEGNAIEKYMRDDKIKLKIFPRPFWHLQE